LNGVGEYEANEGITVQAICQALMHGAANA
jgi:hypothetical protein